MKRPFHGLIPASLVTVIVLLAVPSLVFAGTSTSLANENCDVNGDQSRDVSDAIYLLNWNFVSDSPPPVLFSCEDPLVVSNVENGDCNGDGFRDISDAVFILLWLFNSQSEPVVAICGQTATFAGALTASRGRWTYNGIPGPDGAIALCAETFDGATICTHEQLLDAAAAGELINPLDTSGIPVTSFWIYDSSAVAVEQCRNSVTTSVPWTYATGHIGVNGQFVTLNSKTGLLSEILLDNRCNSVQWLPCCNQ